jgi:hypothetical protein
VYSEKFQLEFEPTVKKMKKKKEENIAGIAVS